MSRLVTTARLPSFPKDRELFEIGIGVDVGHVTTRSLA